MVRGGRASGWMAVAWLAGCVQPTSHPAPADALTVAVLLPYTGERASLGPRIEPALILARDAINDAIGPDDRPIAFEVRDTHSDRARGLDSAHALLMHNPIALLGPEEADLAVDLVPDIAADDALVILPGASTPDAASLGELWQLIGPPPPTVAGAFAQQLQREAGIQRLAVLHVQDPYTTRLASLLACEFVRGRDPATFSAMDVALSESGSNIDRLRSIAEWAPDAVALIAYPRSGANVVRDWVTLVPTGTRWYLAPTLQTDELVANVPPGVLDGAFGLSAAFDVFTATDISNAYRMRFGGGIEVTGARNELVVTAYYYHDALTLVALAAASARAAGEDFNDGAVLRRHFLAVSSPPGDPIKPNELAQGFERLAAGGDIDYDGASGSLDLDDRGAALESNLGTWTVTNGRVLASSLTLPTLRGFLDSPCVTGAP